MQADWTSDDGAIRLYCADCLQVLPELEAGSVDAVVTDPPYEGMKGGTEILGNSGVAKKRHRSMTVGNELGDAAGLVECRRIARYGAIAFCSHHWIEKCRRLLDGKPKGLVTWYKRNSPPPVCNVPWFSCEWAWAVQYAPGIRWRKLKTHFDIPMLQAGCFAAERICNDGRSVHPTQKPVALIQALLLPGMDSVCDPYMGLATTIVACIRTGRRAIGIEREKKYFDVAVERCKAELNRHPLLDAIAPPSQLNLLQDD